MSDPLITYFENHPFIPEIDYKNPFHHTYLRELLEVIQKKDLISILDKLFDTKISKKNHISLVKQFDSELLGICEGHRLDTKLISICGVHLDSIGSIVKLKLMLKTWKSQLFKVDMILSISWENVNIKEILMNLSSSYPNLTIELSTKPLSIFEHYASILSKYHATHSDYHVIFTETNGLWSTKRSMAHMISIIFCKMVEMKYDFVVYPYVLNNSIKKIRGYNEYTSYTIKLSLLGKFIEHVDSRILTNNYCGRYLIKYLNNTINWFGIKVPLVDFTYRLMIDADTDNVSIQELIWVRC